MLHTNAGICSTLLPQQRHRRHGVQLQINELLSALGSYTPGSGPIKGATSELCFTVLENVTRA